MIVNIFNEQSCLAINSSLIEKFVPVVIQNEGQTCDEVNIYLVDTPTICQLHKEYFDDESTTDCISFPIGRDEDDPTPYTILGEVFVCPETAIHYSEKHKTDPYTETTLYIVHALLHLMGYDDLNPEERKQMRLAEKRHMTKLKKMNLILTK